MIRLPKTATDGPLADPVSEAEKELEQLLGSASEPKHGDELVAPEPVVVDASAEQQAFADLLKALADTDEGDVATRVEALTLDAFKAETFCPAIQTEENDR